MYHFEDFTEGHYRQLVTQAKGRFRFTSFEDTASTDPQILWRHDVDFSVHRSLRLAQIENELGVRATYFFLLRSGFYHFWEPPVFDRVRKILDLGHYLGLHFDPAPYGELPPSALEQKAAEERDHLEKALGTRVTAVSFHNPTLVVGKLDTDRYADRVNTYGQSIQNRFAYCSDSNGYWRHQRLGEFLTEPPSQHLQVLTHPGWWVPSPMAPRERIQRCIDGRARAVGADYDRLLKKSERENIGTSVSTDSLGG